jgi:hypothetical protein
MHVRVDRRLPRYYVLFLRMFVALTLSAALIGTAHAQCDNSQVCSCDASPCVTEVRRVQGSAAPAVLTNIPSRRRHRGGQALK